MIGRGEHDSQQKIYCRSLQLGRFPDFWLQRRETTSQRRHWWHWWNRGPGSILDGGRQHHRSDRDGPSVGGQWHRRHHGYRHREYAIHVQDACDRDLQGYGEDAADKSDPEL